MKINVVLFVRIDVLIDGAPAGFKGEKKRVAGRSANKGSCCCAITKMYGKPCPSNINVL